ncbi:hypothetical protein IPL68_01290 [Candidatus Saccharibacteria bacterium]|nr:MAG: hypothetical protein IPL68_01290 [Candidatus Saccharibacteria bacterium]
MLPKKEGKETRPELHLLVSLLFVLTTDKTTRSTQLAAGNLPSTQTSFAA